MPDDEEARAFRVVNCIAACDEPELRTLLAAQGFELLVLRGHGVRDKATFLDQVAADLPRTDGLQPHNWDAFADVLWNVLYDLPHDRVALLWTDADVIVGSDLQDFVDALLAITGVARSVMSGEGSFPRQMTFLTFVLGAAPGYQRLNA